MDATQFLRDDHKRLRGLLIQLAASDLRAHEMKAGVTAQLYMELEIHASIEEEFLYPAVFDRSDAEGKTRVGEARDLIQRVLSLVNELRSVRVDDDTFDDRFQDLADAVLHFTEFEEKQLLPLAEKVLTPGWLDDMGERMKGRRAEALERPEYRMSRPEITQDPNGGEQKRKRPAPAA